MIIRPLPQGFGAEITDFDLANGRDADDVALLQQAYRDHDLLVLRGAETIAPERQVEITGWFGPILAEGSTWTVLDNIEPSGSAVLPFHSDITFLEFPLEGICLHPEALPANDTSTTYVSNAVAWHDLPIDLKSELENRTARHFYDSSHDMGYDWPTFEYWHPVRMINPRTGRPQLFVTEHHVELIEGMDEARSSDVLQRVFATLYAPERRYEHIWRTGDLLIWDNLAVQHSRTRPAERTEGKRIMRRVQLGKFGFLEQAEGVRRRQVELQGLA